MEEKKVSYFLIREKIVAKRESNGKDSIDYLFRDGKWAADPDHVVRDHLAGFDPSEPEDSLNRSGSSGILSEMDEISEKKAFRIINRQILAILKKKWTSEFRSKKEVWDKDPGWPAKLVETEFVLNGISYSLFPTDIGLTDDGWDQGFMEKIQADICKDLEENGATDIYNHGFLD